ncbi:hypothetical protein Pyrfu_1621 [Pyrolobus fumarii 1A]|uniref:Uncharacterized protein n=1 Tax=Pyrolobus fumarii (strain DSM 11204 / 1A) TaxID=694429 RepID=G0ECA8_PYRF1|nr:hypothetical protein [Pyrolobus fumarii]AEM39478.1 hypothetical protein Pyrfu_1621 [Pyrolobus fumarii 1A]
MSLDESFERARREKEKQLYGAGVSQLAVIEREYGYAEIRIFPSVDAVIASSVLHSILRGKGIYTWIVASPLPPDVVREPTILVGFEASIAVSGEFRAPSIVIARGDKPQGLTRAAIVAARDASLTGLALGMMSEVVVTGDRGLLGLAMAYWLGLDRDQRGDFIGPEKWLAELLEVENRAVATLTVKLFDWFEKPVEEAIVYTIDPYYPGLTGSMETVKKFLEADEATSKMLGRSVAEAEEESISRLAERLYEHLRSTSKAPRRPTEVIGVARYTKRLPVADLRKLSNVIAAWIDARGILATMPLASSLDTLLNVMDALYYKMFDDTVESIERGIRTPSLIDRREYGPIRVCIHRGVDGDAAYPLVAKQLRLLGLYTDCMPGVDRGTSIEVLLDPVVDDVKHERIREAIRRGCLRYIDGTLYAEARPC